MATTSEPPTPTREMILAEPAGARLDEWVMEYVLGWQRVPAPKDWSCGALYAFHRSQTVLVCPVCPVVPYGWSATTPDGMADVLGAMEGKAMIVEMRRHALINNQWRVEFWALGQRNDGVFAPSLPLAVAKAALIFCVEEKP